MPATVEVDPPTRAFMVTPIKTDHAKWPTVFSVDGPVGLIGKAKRGGMQLARLTRIEAKETAKQINAGRFKPLRAG